MKVTENFILSKEIVWILKAMIKTKISFLSKSCGCIGINVEASCTLADRSRPLVGTSPDSPTDNTLALDSQLKSVVISLSVNADSFTYGRLNLTLGSPPQDLR